MNRSELLKSREYWIAKIQLTLYEELETYMQDHKLNRAQFAERLGVTRGYVSQVLNGDFNHKISKLVDLALAMGKVPEIAYTDLNKIMLDDNQHNNTHLGFKAVIRGDQTQSLPYLGQQGIGLLLNNERLTA